MNLGKNSRLYISITIFLTIFLPLILGNFLNSQFPIKVINIPLHSGLEVAGGVIAIVIAMIFFIKNFTKLELDHFNYTSLALLSMGILDIFHGIVMPGELFIWLHSCAVFFGGVLFMSVWIKDRIVSQSTYKKLPLYTIILSIVFSLLSIFFKDFIPPMLDDDKSFSMVANSLNILGGIGFFIAALRFLIEYEKTKIEDNLLLAGHTMLFGIAGILFISSVVWDAQWWLWHILRLLAYVIALYFLYIEFDKRIKQIELLSITDGLTSLYNRRYFTQMLPKIINEDKHNNSNLNIILLDIDYFKQYNDTYGHDLGDKALKEVANCFLENIKESDYCFRMGGEEFAILFTCNNKQEAITYANNIIKKIEELQIEHKSSKCSQYLTISAGLFISKAYTIENIFSPYKQADKLLYKAKDEGRNKVISN